MYQLSRLLLLVALAVYSYCVVLLGMICFTISPAIGWVFVFIGFVVLARMRKKMGLTLTAHGTAYWAGENELRQAGMIEARRGLILGRLLGGTKVGLTAGIKALLNGRVRAKDACRAFFAALRRQSAAPGSAAAGDYFRLLRSTWSREIHRACDSLPPELRRVMRRYRLLWRIGPRHGHGPATHGF